MCIILFAKCPGCCRVWSQTDVVQVLHCPRQMQLLRFNVIKNSLKDGMFWPCREQERWGYHEYKTRHMQTHVCSHPPIQRMGPRGHPPPLHHSQLPSQKPLHSIVSHYQTVAAHNQQQLNARCAHAGRQMAGHYKQYKVLPSPNPVTPPKPSTPQNHQSKGLPPKAFDKRYTTAHLRPLPQVRPPPGRELSKVVTLGRDKIALNASKITKPVGRPTNGRTLAQNPVFLQALSTSAEAMKVAQSFHGPVARPVAQLSKAAREKQVREHENVGNISPAMGAPGSSPQRGDIYAKMARQAAVMPAGTVKATKVPITPPSKAAGQKQGV